MTAEEIMEAVKRIQQLAKESGISPMTTETLDDHDLGGVDCELCNNTGTLFRTDENGIRWARECPCMKKRRSLRNIRNSGVADMLDRYTFDLYIADNDIRKKIKKRAMDFTEDKEGWFIVSGRSGSGKTHICASIYGKFVADGVECKYMQWRSDSTSIKAKLNTPEYDEAVDKLVDVPVLYIDDMFKGTVSDADINLAFQILNGRYLDSKKRTIISSEMSLEAMFEKDEAVAGRIYERSHGYRFKAPDENFRLRMQ